MFRSLFAAIESLRLAISQLAGTVNEVNSDLRERAQLDDRADVIDSEPVKLVGNGRRGR